MSVSQTDIGRLGSILDGIFTAQREQRLEDLFAETSDPTAIELYQTWREGKGLTEEEAVQRSAHRSMDDIGEGYDPKNDPAHNTSRVKVRGAYNKATAAGLDEEAEFLRGLAHEEQQTFATLLEAEFLDTEGDSDE